MSKPRLVPQVRIVRAPGTSIITEEQAPLVYTELLKIAEKYKVDNVRALDPKLVFDEVEKDPDHPLRACNYDWNDKSAARKQRIDHTAKLMRAIRYETVVGNLKRFDPVWIYVTIPPGATRQQPQRARVLREDVLRSDPSFVSALGYQIRQVKDALARLEHLVTSRESPESIVGLVESMRAVMADYDVSILNKAAE